MEPNQFISIPFISINSHNWTGRTKPFSPGITSPQKEQKRNNKTEMIMQIIPTGISNKNYEKHNSSVPKSSKLPNNCVHYGFFMFHINTHTWLRIDYTKHTKNPLWSALPPESPGSSVIDSFLTNKHHPPVASISVSQRLWSRSCLPDASNGISMVTAC